MFLSSVPEKSRNSVEPAHDGIKKAADALNSAPPLFGFVYFFLRFLSANLLANDNIVWVLPNTTSWSSGSN